MWLTRQTFNTEFKRDTWDISEIFLLHTFLTHMAKFIIHNSQEQSSETFTLPPQNLAYII